MPYRYRRSRSEISSGSFGRQASRSARRNVHGASPSSQALSSGCRGRLRPPGLSPRCAVAPASLMCCRKACSAQDSTGYRCDRIKKRIAQAGADSPNEIRLRHYRARILRVGCGAVNSVGKTCLKLLNRDLMCRWAMFTRRQHFGGCGASFERNVQRIPEGAEAMSGRELSERPNFLGAIELTHGRRAGRGLGRGAPIGPSRAPRTSPEPETVDLGGELETSARKRGEGGLALLESGVPGVIARPSRRRRPPRLGPGPRNAGGKS
jgi:hypothetical protein